MSSTSPYFIGLYVVTVLVVKMVFEVSPQRAVAVSNENARFGVESIRKGSFWRSSFVDVLLEHFKHAFDL